MRFLTRLGAAASVGGVGAMDMRFLGTCKTRGMRCPSLWASVQHLSARQSKQNADADHREDAQDCPQDDADGDFAELRKLMKLVRSRPKGKNDHGDDHACKLHGWEHQQN